MEIVSYCKLVPDEIGIAFNKDEKAPIFKECAFGLAGDMMEIMPKVIEGLK